MKDSKKSNASAAGVAPKQRNPAQEVPEASQPFLKENKKSAEFPTDRAFVYQIEPIEGHSLLLDKLRERLAFERSCIRLYDTLLQKILAMKTPPAAPGIEDLKQLRDEELDHFLLVANTLREMGIEPNRENPVASTDAVSKGILKVLSASRTSVPQCLSVLFSAELMDCASWQVLIQMANSMELTDLSQKFQQALATESEHVQKVRVWLSPYIHLGAAAA